MSELTIKQQIRLEHRKGRTAKNLLNWWSYLELNRSKENPETFNELVKEVIFERMAAEDRLKAFKNSRYFQMKIRKYCNRHGYSDIEPFEVVRVISHRKIEVRMMEAKLITAPIQHVGGFCAHTENDTQEWECISVPENCIREITLTKKGWGQGEYRMSKEPRNFYDYNF
jgi:hypothetical protein